MTQCQECDFVSLYLLTGVDERSEGTGSDVVNNLVWFLTFLPIL